ncbi:hypothetical protein PbB2_01855 [Candidatus Phycosocius bacilliformis]|uniref:Minor curlin subunit n=1 Tax=Candidatus Phycosocius bacilliformis TaxID=1445552 RepID=A0A2P2EAW6_9PROT|nr:hypothetical protein [Candidatus Phycosocius bacilliformis]GBF58183.1 hypothetical protein PbB2_01855 [Candidatus Phycosocius bacilliformis]
MTKMLILRALGLGLMLGLGLSAPAAAQSGAYISQIGAANRASISQDGGAISGLAKVEQDGERNVADIFQTDAAHQTRVDQTGSLNEVLAIQRGGQSHVGVMTQEGSGNHISLAQISAVATQSAAITQLGDGNKVTLSQDGTANSATLTQIGNNNLMSLAQTGGGVISWKQEGNNLAPIEMVIGGGQILFLTQVRP